MLLLARGAGSRKLAIPRGAARPAIRICGKTSRPLPGNRTLIVGPPRAAAAPAEQGPSLQQVDAGGPGKEEAAPSSGVEPARATAEQESLEQMEVSTAVMNVDDLAQAITSKCSTSPGLLVKCSSPRAVPAVLQALAVAGSNFGSRLQVLPMARYNRSKIRLSEALEMGCGANFTVRVVPKGSQAQAPELPESQLRRVSSQGVAARLASVICADIREQQQCIMTAVGYRAIDTGFQAMVLARMRLLFPPGSSVTAGTISPQATPPPPPMNFAVYPSVKAVQLEGQEGLSKVMHIRLLPHTLPDLQNERYVQRRVTPVRRASQAGSPSSQAGQQRPSNGTMEVPIEEWAALKQSVELLSKQNRDLFELCTRALQSKA